MLQKKKKNTVPTAAFNSSEELKKAVQTQYSYYIALH